MSTSFCPETDVCFCDEEYGRKHLLINCLVAQWILSLHRMAAWYFRAFRVASRPRLA